jgi:rifampin ADP-ribosylating transferase
MNFDPNNPVINRCAEGLRLEREGNTSGAYQIFQQAWKETTSEWEKIIAAQYLAGYQYKASDKLQWDLTALQSAMNAGYEPVSANYSALYLEIAASYEELRNLEEAGKYYQLALSFAGNLPSDAYGRMIQLRIQSGLERLSRYLPRW